MQNDVPDIERYSARGRWKPTCGQDVGCSRGQKCKPRAAEAGTTATTTAPCLDRLHERGAQWACATYAVIRHARGGSGVYGLPELRAESIVIHPHHHWSRQKRKHLLWLTVADRSSTLDVITQILQKSTCGRYLNRCLQVHHRSK